MRKSILDEISALKYLPTLPHILLKLIKACGQDQGSLKEISKIVEKDPSLAGKVLRLVNSAYYGLPRKVGNMEQAVTYLGTDAVKNTAVCASVLGVFNQAKGDSVFNMKLFWRHSLKCALLARLMADRARSADPDEAFLSGLLHDIGRLVLWVNFKRDYSRLLEMYSDRPDLLTAGEIRLGATHCEIGASLIQRWKLKSFMADAVLYHHEPISRIRSALPLVQVVYCANLLSADPPTADARGIGVVEELLGISPSDMEQTLSRAEEELEKTASSLGIDIGKPGETLPPASEKDLQTQEDLVQEVRDASMLLGTLQGLLAAEDETAILREVFRGIQILFDLHQVIFFLHDPEKEGLLGKSLPDVNGPPMVEDLIVPLKMEKSLIVESVRQGAPADSFGRSRDLAIMDEQLLRLLGGKGLFCVPLKAYGATVGAILIGLNEAEFSSLSKERKLLEMLAKEAAVALHVHALRRTQQKSIQEERVSASSDMARKVVHEVNNPLSIIKNYLKILGMKLADKEIAQDEIRIINEEIDRVVAILQELTDFSSNRVHSSEDVDVNALLADLVKITKESLIKDAGIEVRTDFDPSVPHISADKNALKQVFVNLIKNASEALSGGGKLDIKTRHISSRLKGETGIDRRGRGEFVEIVVSDNGPGIPEAVRSRLFEPFTSSKGRGHEGLGLSIVHNIVTSLNGNISCESERDRGASFRITLPVVQERETE